jgi:hypothetical protein
MFVGRARELASLQNAVAAALSGSGRLLLVCGEPGIGKSALAGQVVRGVGTDATVAWASALGPWDGSSDEPWPTVLEQCALLRRRPRPRPLAAALADAAAVRPLLVVLDDLHRATTPALHLLLDLTPRLAVMPVAVLGLASPEQPPREEAARALLARVHRQAEVVVLDGLPVADIGALARGLNLPPDDAEDVIEAVHRASGGNPYLAGELLRVLAEQHVQPDPSPGVRPLASP